ncbi:MAG: 4a-hydroxytetrahydrobiopterin dehydratase [Fuerstia sp.]|nr:4a-hydroxytetrahydrobiopterin dehydratase [Fuerstiella sp.]
MTTASSKSHTELRATRCVPCEGGVPKMTVEEATAQLKELPGWELLSGPDRIRKTWVVRDFKAGMDFFAKVTDVAEAERHHPDLHLVGYRNVSIEIWTHAINGLSLNDFILAARIDEIPVVQKNP